MITGIYSKHEVIKSMSTVGIPYVVVKCGTQVVVRRHLSVVDEELKIKTSVLSEDDVKALVAHRAKYFASLIIFGSFSFVYLFFLFLKSCCYFLVVEWTALDD